MADEKVIEGTDITTSQMKEFWRLVDDGIINRAVLQALIENHAEQDGRVLIIDRSVPFNPAFMGDGWKIEEQDKLSVILAEIDFNKVSFETCLKEGESCITGEKKLKRHAKAKHVCADAKIGQTLYEEEGQKTLDRIYREKGITWLELLGTTLRSPDGDRCALILYRGDGCLSWTWNYGWLDNYRYADYPSLVLAST
ncbi:MAG: hypothetical protein WC878_00080 [Candidatus Paceibacterota bacterium]|jgi:hypothetical protein